MKQLLLTVLWCGWILWGNGIYWEGGKIKMVLLNPREGFDTAKECREAEKAFPHTVTLDSGQVVTTDFMCFPSDFDPREKK